MKVLPLERKIAGVLPYLKSEGLVAEPVTDADRARIEAVILALGDRLKVFSDILKLGRFFFTKKLVHDPDAVKKRLRKEGVPAMLAELDAVLAEVEPYDLATLEKVDPRLCRAVRAQDGRRGQSAAGRRRPVRGSVQGSTTACSSWAGRRAGPGSRRPSTCSERSPPRPDPCLE